MTPTYNICYPYPNPNSVTFTFDRNQNAFCQQPQNFWQCQTPGFENLAQLQQRNEIDWLQLQKQLSEPYRLKFHLDNQTSTSDLGAKQNEADFKNIAAQLLKKWPPWLQNPTHRDHKKLILRNVTAKEEESIVDELLKGKSVENLGNSKKVSFNLKQDEECQVEMGCKCCENSEPKTRHKRGRRKSPRRKYSSTDDEDRKEDTR